MRNLSMGCNGDVTECAIPADSADAIQGHPISSLGSLAMLTAILRASSPVSFAGSAFRLRLGDQKKEPKAAVCV
jgi:hypothetical protein